MKICSVLLAVTLGSPLAFANETFTQKDLESLVVSTKTELNSLLDQLTHLTPKENRITAIRNRLLYNQKSTACPDLNVASVETLQKELGETEEKVAEARKALEEKVAALRYRVLAPFPEYIQAVLDHKFKKIMESLESARAFGALAEKRFYLAEQDFAEQALANVGYFISVAKRYEQELLEKLQNLQITQP